VLRPLNSRDPSDLSKKKGLKLDKAGYKKKILKLLEGFIDDGKMTLEEVVDKIVAIPIPKETKNPYVGLSTKEDGAYR